MPGLPTLTWKTLVSTRSRWRSVGEQPRLKVAFVSLFAVGLFIGLWLLFARGFRFLDQFEGASVLILGRLFALFFFGMGSMIVVSGIVTSYASIYRSDELTFLLTRPIRISDIVLYKYGETIVFASWAFFFIIIPFVGAFSLHQGLPLAFPVWTVIFSLPFIALCSSIGVLTTLICVRFFPPRAAVRSFGLFMLVGACAGAVYLLHGSEEVEEQSAFVLARLIPGLQLASHPLLPSKWLAEGVLAFARGHADRGGMFMVVLTTNAMVAAYAVYLLGGSVFYTSWQRVQGASSRQGAPPDLPEPLRRVLRLLPRDLGSIVLKDIRIFMRDPMQWTQVLVFFGLLALYFANLRSFNYHLLEPGWKNTVAFLNVFSVSAVMCSLGSRFVYPQLSLEGQQFWIIGLSPTSMTRVLAAKFTLAFANMLLVGTGLVALSTFMLDLEPRPRVIAIAVSVCVSATIASLSTGLGAIFLDLKQRNPAAIVSGFGGTLNLVLCLMHMLGCILPYGMTLHLYFGGRISAHQMHQALDLSTLWLCVITIAACIIPLYLGRRSLDHREY